MSRAPNPFLYGASPAALAHAYAPKSFATPIVRLYNRFVPGVYKDYPVITLHPTKGYNPNPYNSDKPFGYVYQDVNETRIIYSIHLLPIGVTPEEEKSFIATKSVTSFSFSVVGGYNHLYKAYYTPVKVVRNPHYKILERYQISVDEDVKPGFVQKSAKIKDECEVTEHRTSDHTKPPYPSEVKAEKAAPAAVILGPGHTSAILANSSLSIPTTKVMDSIPEERDGEKEAGQVLDHNFISAFKQAVAGISLPASAPAPKEPTKHIQKPAAKVARPQQIPSDPVPAESSETKFTAEAMVSGSVAIAMSAFPSQRVGLTTPGSIDLDTDEEEDNDFERPDETNLSTSSTAVAATTEAAPACAGAGSPAASKKSAKKKAHKKVISNDLDIDEAIAESHAASVGQKKPNKAVAEVKQARTKGAKIKKGVISLDEDDEIIDEIEASYIEPINETKFVFTCSKMLSAVYRNDVKRVEQLLKSDRDSLDAKIEVTGMYPVHLAAAFGSYKSLLAILRAEPSQANRVDSNGLSPMVHAILNGKADCVDLLIESGANLAFVKPDGESLIHTASYSGNIGVLKSLLDAISPEKRAIAVNLQYDVDLSTPAHCAFDNPKYLVNVLKVLYAYGARFNIPNIKGSLPMHLAAAFGYLEVIELLHSYDDKQFNVHNSDGISPLQFAARYGKLNTAKKLLSWGANPFNISVHGNNIMHSAVLSKNLSLIKFFHDKFPTLVEQRNNDGETPYELKDALADHDILSFFREALRKPEIASSTDLSVPEGLIDLKAIREKLVTAKNSPTSFAEAWGAKFTNPSSALSEAAGSADGGLASAAHDGVPRLTNFSLSKKARSNHKADTYSASEFMDFDHSTDDMPTLTISESQLLKIVADSRRLGLEEPPSSVIKVSQTNSKGDKESLSETIVSSKDAFGMLVGLLGSHEAVEVTLNLYEANLALRLLGEFSAAGGGVDHAE